MSDHGFASSGMFAGGGGSGMLDRYARTRRVGILLIAGMVGSLFLFVH